MWQVETGERQCSLEQETDGFFTAALFSPDGRSVLTATREPNWETVTLWSSSSGLEIEDLGTSGIYNMVASRHLGHSISSP